MREHELERESQAVAIVSEVVRVKRAAAILGETEKAIRRRIEDKTWLEGREYHRRGGVVWIDLMGVGAWSRGETSPPWEDFPPGKPTALYRHFDASGTLLYIGISLNPIARLRRHQRSSWADSIAHVEIVHFSSREEALEAEAAAIRTEEPRFNVHHRRGARR